MINERLETEKIELERSKLRTDYLIRQYGFYTTHMNQVFNFYLVAAALIASAFVQSLSGPSPLETAGSRAIAIGGAALSFVFWALHMRGFQIADALDHELKRIEPQLSVRFMRRRKRSQALVILLGSCLPRSWRKRYIRRYREAARPPAIGEKRKKSPASPLVRNTFMFSVIYLGFVAAFLLSACSVEAWRSNRSRALQISVSQSLANTPRDEGRAGAAVTNGEANPSPDSNAGRSAPEADPPEH